MHSSPMTEIEDNLTRLAAELEIHFDSNEYDCLFLGHILEIHGFGAMLERGRTIIEIAKISLKIFQMGLANLYFDNYGNLAGHLFWLLPNSLEKEQLCKLSMPPIRLPNSTENYQVCVLSLSAVSNIIASVKYDLQKITSISSESIFYIRLYDKQWKLVDMRLKKRASTGKCNYISFLVGVGASERQLIKKIKLNVAKRGALLYAYMRVARFRDELNFSVRTMAPLRLNQFHVYKNEENLPVGAITWGWVSEETLSKFIATPFRYSAPYWKAGTKLIIVDAIGDYEGCLADAVINGRLPKIYPAPIPLNIMEI